MSSWPEDVEVPQHYDHQETVQPRPLFVPPCRVSEVEPVTVPWPRRLLFQATPVVEPV